MNSFQIKLSIVIAVGVMFLLFEVSSVECQNNNSLFGQSAVKTKNITITIGNVTQVIIVPEALTDEILNFIKLFIMSVNITGVIDVNECISDIDNCTVNETCLNIGGVSEHMCICNDGFSKADDSDQCTDIDECALGNFTCHVNATCTNTVGGYNCVCETNFTGNGTVCTMIDACAINSCSEIENCKAVAGAALCECKAGYISNGTSCVDLDECAEPNASGSRDDSMSSTSTILSTTTVASTIGVVVRSNVKSRSSTTITDATSTLTDSVCPDNERCQNSPGSYSCVCETGFMRNGTICKDVDECAARIDNCSANANCENTKGSYTCTCKSGYTGDGQTCVDVDECAARIDNCSANANCENTKGSYTCTCKSGYTGDGQTCVDVDECAARIVNCSANANCENTKGSYTCTCKLGYTGDGQTCVDVDECAARIDNCSANANCENTKGSYTCTCKSGYTGDGQTCVDVDECAARIDNCSANANCENTKGSYTCTCKSGYTGDGQTCVDVDECAARIVNCSANANCENTKGSYTCTCKLGYTGDGQTCVDVDECAARIDNCSANANCENTKGSYTCTCKSGYTGDGQTCVDIDECTRATASCPKNSTCVNTNGSYTCECNSGYTGSESECFDIDECTASTHSCSGNSFCENTDGSFTCPCNVGFTLNESVCVDIDECESNPCDPNANCNNADGSFHCECNPPFVGDGTSCDCQNGYKQNSANTTCIDVNECADGTNTCTEEQECENTDGSFVCPCNDQHFEINGKCIARERTIIITAGLSSSRRRKRTVSPDDLTQEELVSAIRSHLEDFVVKVSGSKINVTVTVNQQVDGRYSFVVSADPEWLEHVRVGISKLSSIRLNDTCTITFQGLLYTKTLNYVGDVANVTNLNETICNQVKQSVLVHLKSKFNDSSIVTCSFNASQLSVSVQDTFANLHDLNEVVNEYLSSQNLSISDIDECEPNRNICPEKCTNSVGSFVCSCPNSTFDLDVSNPGFKCVHPIRTTCGKDSIHAEVYIAYFETYGVPLNTIHLLSKSCLGTVGSQFLTFDFKLHECSTIKYHVNDTVVYSNNVTNQDNGVNVFNPSFAINVSCTYSSEFNTTESNDTATATVTSTILIINPTTGEGDLEVTLFIYKDDAPLKTTDVLEVGDKMQIMATQSGPGLFMKVTTCWATPTNNPTNNRYEFITNECPSSDRDITVTVVENGNTNTTHIEITVFSFSGYPDIFLHCQVKVCEEPCQKNCETNGRRRRQVIHSQEPENLVSIGPIKVTGASADTDNMTDNDEQVTGSDSAVIGTSVSLGIAVCIIIAFVVHRKFKKHPNREGAYRMSQWQ